MRVTFLGTGTSRGIPVVGCDCRVCASSHPKNKRSRTSVLIESGARVVVDTSVDFRMQMLRHRVRRLDAIVYTHHHVDHILGLDDVYPFNIWSRKAMPVYGSPVTLKELKTTFRYLFSENSLLSIPRVKLIPINGSFRIADLKFEPVEALHGNLRVLGFRLGQFAYLTDVSYIPEASLNKLMDLEILVLDGLRYKSHPTHFSLSEAAETARLVGAKQSYLVHMCHDVDHDEGNQVLPDSVNLAYDGLALEL